MAQATTIKGGMVRILLGSGAGPIVYAAPCGFTQRTITLNKGLEEVEIPDCDADDVVSWLGRDAVSLSMSVNGEGVLAAESVETWVDAFGDDDSVPVKVEWEFPDTTITWTGFMHVESLEVGAPRNGRATLNVTLQSDGPLARVAGGVLRIHNVSATESFIIAPVAGFGAIAVHQILGNGGDNTTPSDSVGAPFGDWRLRGLRRLLDVDANPVTEYAEIIQDGLGAQEIAINLANVWAGMYHGFGAGAAYAQTGTDLLLSRAGLSTVQLDSAGEMRWSGATATWDGSLAVNTDGSISTSAHVNLAADPLSAYLDMTIVGPNFTRASLDGGATWENLATLAVNATLAANVDTIIMRNPITGTTVTVTDDALDGTPGRSKVIARRASDYKVYADLNPTPSGTLLGDVEVNRTIAFGTTTPDPVLYTWDGVINADSGYLSPVGWNPLQRTFDNTNKQLVFARGGGGYSSGNCRTLFPMTGLTIGAVYNITFTAALSGAGVLSGGVTMSVTTDTVTGGGGTSPGTMSAAIAAGSTPYSFTATAATMYLLLNQIFTAASDQVFRVNRISLPVPV